MRKKQSVLQFLKFLGFSLGAGVIEAGTFTIVFSLWGNETGLKVAEISSVILSCLFNFTLNRKFTFQNAGNIAVGMALYGLYYLVATPLGAVFILWLVRNGWNEFLAKAVKMILNFALDFTYCKLVIFRKPR